LHKGVSRGRRAFIRLGAIPAPLRIKLALTDRCNLRCPTCSKWNGNGLPPELRLDDWLGFLERVRDLRPLTCSSGSILHPSAFILYL
jgi:hypothetical protein